jgi:hypothetical protein
MSLGTSHFFMLRHHRIQHITIPSRINHIVILTTQAQSSVFLRYDHLVFKSFKKIELQAGGTHFCICDMPAMTVHRSIETKDRVFSQHQHPQEDILILLETAHSDTAVPRLWDSCAMALLIQGVTHCDLELAFPLFTLKTIRVTIKSYDSVLNEFFHDYPQSKLRFVQTCACHTTHQDLFF